MKKDYNQFVRTTFNFESTSDIYLCQRLCDCYHAAMGLAGEWLELILDLQKPDRDETAIIKELGDCCYYVAMLENLFGILAPVPDIKIGYQSHETTQQIKDGCAVVENLVDAVKKKIAYKLDNQQVRKPIEETKLFIAKLAMQFGLSYEEIQSRNVQKLSVRYKNGFTKEEAALKRDAATTFNSI